MNLKELNEYVITLAKTVPGIYEINYCSGLETIVLKSEKANNAIDIKMELFLIENSFSKIIVEELFEIINYQLQQKNIVIDIFDIYIKGIK
ncbi:hypothetical protein [Metamycoplasma hyosynoviae]|uniref:Uncharacterized protein n=1 Tax=Metamycoplasma hyosynoviae TaxID=29559 RepID=A0A063Y6M9_9BACT|nr:hypothetical protein [Metamycoplasma hyosynoviae]KDE41795.1 hypothetical protein NPL3_02990 [Metamycoplasma hyosynoviae]KDE42053.1 hypothetical protein NPL7_01330 [Metamycoplasma hyosynoviae]KDE42796.1 hypothetical protein NPL5_03515 [Metamycoplasma hyosynoviae]KDE43441.1 hypothetical protein NPL1_00685 [Metamycoplasma hyosynoviae]KDE44259.1 hypothetical protein NPL6_02130 [Metamycoplasma hyosynoviae]